MTTIREAPTAPLSTLRVEEDATRWRKERRRWAPTPDTRQAATLFTVASVGYFLLGAWLLEVPHILVFDGFARLSHAYFVWWNDPPKLTAIGFVWPPVATLVFLPYTVFKPLATSLLALPLMTSMFAGALLVVLERLFRASRMSARERYALVAAFALNPMIAFYAANGMAEIVYLFFLVTGVYSFYRWYLTRRPGSLIVASVCLAFGILSRYEVLIWAAVATVSIALAAIRQRVTRGELEGTLLTYLAPLSYGVGLWVFFNWLILGRPFFFLHQQTPGAGINGAQAIVQAPPGSTTAAHVVRDVVVLNVELFPATLAVLVALALVFYRRRDLMTLSLIAFLLLNAAFTAAIVYESGARSYLQLRYNMRAMPLTFVGIAWLHLVAKPRYRRLVWGAGLAAVVLSIPATAYAMRTYPFQYLERNFVGAILFQERLKPSLQSEDAMARYITRRRLAESSILTDDSQTFSVMLRTGRPGLFFDRIDRGDTRWRDTLENPWGHVRYFLLLTDGSDLISERFPALVDRRRVPGLTPEYAAGRFLLVRVSPTPPPRGGRRLSR